MDDETWRTERFERSRSHLHGVAHRMLGSASEADDAVQEAWMRLSRTDTSDVDDLTAWLTTVVARVCLDMLRSRASRREDALPADIGPDLGPRPAGPAGLAAQPDPEREALVADAIGPALLIALDALTPAERIAFVLHDVFALPFDDIAAIVDRSPEAARQLASRARRRVRGAGSVRDDPARRAEVVGAFLAAARDGDFDSLVAVLDPDVVLRADATVVAVSRERQAIGAPALAPVVRGAPEVAEAFSGRARTARPARIDGVPGAAWAPEGRLRAVFGFEVAEGRIVAVDVVADPDELARLDVVLLDA